MAENTTQITNKISVVGVGIFQVKFIQGFSIDFKQDSTAGYTVGSL